ncbi:MAG TPA: glycosyltransferase family 2 protein [Kofleriaceae bacterium]|nr:glycosyltransferase family 2 protein [Kofleriaceae bacterium]
MSSVRAAELLVDLVVVARNCAGSLGATLAAVPARELRSVVVVDNGSSDASALVARDAGAVVLFEPVPGYGTACRRAISHMESLPRPPDVVVFLAADGSADPADIPALLEPVRAEGAELVIGVRQPDAGDAAPGGAHHERVALGLIGLIYRHQFSDLGPSRAIRFPALVALGLTDRGSGWNAEMQVKALRYGLRIAEVPVAYHAPLDRGGGSRVTELKDSVSTAGRMIFQILRHATAR